MKARSILALAFPLLLACQGCTLVGLGIGAACPKYEETAVAPSPPPASLTQPREGGTKGERADTRTRAGSYWLEGLVTGAAFDALTLTMLAVAASSYHPGSLTGSFQ